MEITSRFNLNLVLFFSLIIALGLVSFSLCLVAESKKLKKKDLRFDGHLCSLPGSPAFGFGIAALICLFAGQVIGNLFLCRKFCVSDHRSGCNNKKIQRPTITSIFLVLSWISFGIVVLLISTATSMSRGQPYGEGWLDGDCYLVKSGVYSSSAALAILTVCLTLSSVFKVRQKRVEEDKKIHAQAE